MLKYISNTPPLERLGAAVAEALAEGVTQQELMGVVLSTVATYTPSMADEADCEDFRAPGPDTVYTELPPGLIDLPSAARESGIASSTLHMWLARGHIKSYGRLKGYAKGGGIHLLKAVEIQARQGAPPNKGGRPRKPVKRS